MDDLSRLSFNQMTAERATLPQVAEACARQGIPYVGVWRHKIAQTGLEHAAGLLRDAGVKVSSVCRGGMFPAATSAEREARIEDNRRAIDEAATLGAPVLVLVCGPAPDRDIEGARRMVEDGIRAVADDAAERGVTLAIEPLHPAFAGDRSVITTLSEARRLAERIAHTHVAVVPDVYHIWWDPDLYAEIERAKGWLAGFHVNDWLVPPKEVLMNRGMMGDGVIELRRMREAVDRAGWDGPIEVEIFNEQIWAMPLDELLELTKARYLEWV